MSKINNDEQTEPYKITACGKRQHMKKNIGLIQMEKNRINGNKLFSLGNIYY